MIRTLKIGLVAVALAGVGATAAWAGADDGGNKAFFQTQESPAAAAAATPDYSTGVDQNARATVPEYDQYRAQGRRVSRRPLVNQ